MGYLNKGLLTDILLNVLLPLIAGAFIYYLSSILSTQGFIINQLPDGCWAYAFISCMLIIWNRQINPFWIAIAFIITSLFEVLQYLQYIQGTGDLWDIFTYFLATILALSCNRFFYTKIYTTTTH
jgi:hypothetical protein